MSTGCPDYMTPLPCSRGGEVDSDRWIDFPISIAPSNYSPRYFNVSVALSRFSLRYFRFTVAIHFPRKYIAGISTLARFLDERARFKTERDQKEIPRNTLVCKIVHSAHPQAQCGEQWEVGFPIPPCEIELSRARIPRGWWIRDARRGAV